MHGYLMFSKILVCQVVPPDEVHPNTFKHSSKPYRHINWVTRERQRHNTVRGQRSCRRTWNRRRAKGTIRAWETGHGAAARF
jgi:nucleolar protein 15